MSISKTIWRETKKLWPLVPLLAFVYFFSNWIEWKKKNNHRQSDTLKFVDERAVAGQGITLSFDTSYPVGFRKMDSGWYTGDTLHYISYAKWKPDTHRYVFKQDSIYVPSWQKVPEDTIYYNSIGNVWLVGDETLWVPMYYKGKFDTLKIYLPDKIFSKPVKYKP